jgi:voltage-gated sodium channel
MAGEATPVPDDVSGVAAPLWRVTHAPWFRGAVTVLILVSAVIVGLETYPEVVVRHGETLRRIDGLILAAFIVEIVLRVLAHGARPWRFFTDGWNVFDFVIVAACLVPGGGQLFAVARLARVLRVLRLLTAVPRLQVLVSALFSALPSIGYVALLLGLLFYVYACIGWVLFAANDPGHFGTLDRAMLTLFRTVTLEDWTDLMYTQMLGADRFPPELGPNTGWDLAPAPGPRPVIAVVYFVSFVLIGTVVVLNLFIGVVLNSMNEAQAAMARRTLDRGAASADLPARLRSLEARAEEVLSELRRIRENAERHGP